MKIQYSVLDDDPSEKMRFSMVTLWNPAYYLHHIAEDCAAHYDEWHVIDGRPTGGNPRQFALFGENGAPLGVYDVSMTYRATLRKEQ